MISCKYYFFSWYLFFKLIQFCILNCIQTKNLFKIKFGAKYWEIWWSMRLLFRNIEQIVYLCHEIIYLYLRYYFFVLYLQGFWDFETFTILSLIVNKDVPLNWVSCSTPHTHVTSWYQKWGLVSTTRDEYPPVMTTDLWDPRWLIWGWPRHNWCQLSLGTSDLPCSLD